MATRDPDNGAVSKPPDPILQVISAVPVGLRLMFENEVTLHDTHATYHCFVDDSPSGLFSFAIWTIQIRKRNKLFRG